MLKGPNKRSSSLYAESNHDSAYIGVGVPKRADGSFDKRSVTRELRGTNLKGVVWSSEDAQRASTPTKDKSRDGGLGEYGEVSYHDVVQSPWRAYQHVGSVLQSRHVNKFAGKVCCLTSLKESTSTLGSEPPTRSIGGAVHTPSRYGQATSKICLASSRVGETIIAPTCLPAQSACQRRAWLLYPLIMIK
eukprot:4959213-Pyramimonas_sp.AAC.1